MEINEMTKGISMKEETKIKIEELIKLSTQTSKNHRKQQLARSVDEILSDIFDTGFSFMIPRTFLDTELGVLLFRIKYANQYYYTTFDMEIILDRVKSNLYFHRNQGNLKLINHGGSYEATEKALRDFLHGYVGLSNEEVDKRFEAFWNVKNSSSKKIGRKAFKEQFDKMLNGTEKST